MPALPSSVLDPLRAQFLALIDIAEPAGPDTHPLGCHRTRIPDAIVFDHLIAALVFGAGYERIADEQVSATTLRRRRDEWIHAGLFVELAALAVTAYDAMIGLDLVDVAVDGCITKAPCGGECAGRSPVDRGKGGLKRSQVCDGAGIPLAALPAPANRRDHQMLAVSLDALAAWEPLPEHVTVHLDAGYDYKPCRAELTERGLGWSISKRGTPVQVGRRWVVEAANSWLNDFGRLRRCTERREAVVQAYLDLAIAAVTVRALIRAAWSRYRWEGRPRSVRIR